MPKISELTTAIPTTDDYIPFVDNADGTTKKSPISDFPFSATSATALLSTVRNNTGATLFKGTIVYVTGGIGGVPTVAKARANAESTSSGTFAVIYADIPNNTNGQALTAGKIDTLDTRSTATNPFTSVTLADGDKIYLDPTTAGYITNVKPVAPNHLVYLGTVTNANPTTGTIEYRIINGFELDEIHDILITSKSDGDVLVYENSTTLWKNKTPDNAGLVTKTGTQTLTNKRITKRIQSASPVSSPYQIDVSTTDTQEITSLGIALQFQNPAGIPTNGQLVLIRIKDNGTARALTYDTQFSSGAATLPTTTTISKWTWILCEYVTADTKWYCIATGTQP